jgi:cation transport regulator ChaB
VSPAQLENIDVSTEALVAAINHARDVFQEWLDAAQAVKDQADRLVTTSRERKHV